MMSSVVTRRRCSKVLLVDEHDRVLLLSGIDRTKPDMVPWWFPVGGEAEPTETLSEAAIRETLEETGREITDPGPVVFTRRFTWEFEGQHYDQEESFFLVRTTTFEPQSVGWTDTEAATIQEWRWWSVDELRSTESQVFPEDLADHLERLLGPDSP